MSAYISLQRSIASAVESYESYKSQTVHLDLANLSLGGPVSDSSDRSHPAARVNKNASARPVDSTRREEAISNPRDSSLHHPKESVRRASFTSSSGRDAVVRAVLDAPVHRPGIERRPSSPVLRGSSIRNFGEFVTTAENYETLNFSLDLDFLLMVLDFLRREHPYTSNTLQKAIKTRNAAKKKLWTQYTTEMQSLARNYTLGKTLSPPGPSSPLSSENANTGKKMNKVRQSEIIEIIAKLENQERTCGESILSALSHLHSQAMKDIYLRWNMPDPINDKKTPIERHNERVRVFNQLIKFLSDDLRRSENLMRTTGQVYKAEKKKDKKGAGVVEAIESLCVNDYPPYST